MCARKGNPFYYSLKITIELPSAPKVKEYFALAGENIEINDWLLNWVFVLKSYRRSFATINCKMSCDQVLGNWDDCFEGSLFHKLWWAQGSIFLIGLHFCELVLVEKVSKIGSQTIVANASLSPFVRWFVALYCQFRIYGSCHNHVQVDKIRILDFGIINFLADHCFGVSYFRFVDRIATD